MAHRSELRTAVPPHPGRVLLHRATTPGLVYRLAAWRRPAVLGNGRLVVHGRGRSSAHLDYRAADDGKRADCLRRQTWILRVPASCGASRATLREEGCLAEGDAACRYLVSWTEGARLLPGVLVGMLVVAVLASTRLPTAAPEAWLLVPAVSAVAYTIERWRVARANPLATAQSSAAFRWLVGRALAGRPAPTSEPTEQQSERARLRDLGLSIEQEGDMWRVEYEGTTLRLRHSRGLALLAHLVRNPGEEIHVSTLDAITPSGGSVAARSAPAPDGGVVPAPGDAGEILDGQARAEYRRRIVELRGELEEAEARHDIGRIEVTRAELELLEDEIRAAVGPGGQVRRAGGDAERLRVAITHRIRAAIAQIAQRDPALGAHLAASVSTGYRCVYQPAERLAVADRADRPAEQKA